MLVRQDIVLLDLDGMLINTAISTKYQVIWNGGVEIWVRYLSLLQEAANSSSRRIFFGIATFKDLYRPQNKGSFMENLVGDVISAVVLEDLSYLPFVNVAGLGTGMGLKRFISEQLIFFTNRQSKVTYALDLARYKLQTLVGEEAAQKSNVVLVDDQKVICDDARANGYPAICTTPLEAFPPGFIKTKIANIFKEICDTLQLQVPNEILIDAGYMGHDQIGSDAIIIEIANEEMSEEDGDDELSEIDDMKNISELDEDWGVLERNNKRRVGFFDERDVGDAVVATGEENRRMDVDGGKRMRIE